MKGKKRKQTRMSLPFVPSIRKFLILYAAGTRSSCRATSYVSRRKLKGKIEVNIKELRVKYWSRIVRCSVKFRYDKKAFIMQWKECGKAIQSNILQSGVNYITSCCNVFDNSVVLVLFWVKQRVCISVLRTQIVKKLSFLTRENICNLFYVSKEQLFGG